VYDRGGEEEKVFNTNEDRKTSHRKKKRESERKQKREKEREILLRQRHTGAMDKSRIDE
jgi:hypothetical protein